MLVGHIDGKGTVYDDAGNLILSPGEALLCQTADDNVLVTERSGFWTVKTLLHQTAEKGRLIVTDRRIVFLRKPNPFLAAKYDAYPLGMADAVTNAVRAHDLRKMKAWEFCQVEFDEVNGFLTKGQVVGVLYLVSPMQVTRRVLLHRKDETDTKLTVIRNVLKKRLPVTRPEDRRGNSLLGERHPAFRRGRKASRIVR